MLANIPMPSGLPRLTWGGGRLVAGGIAAALVVLSIVIGLEVSAAAVRSGVEIFDDSSREAINRTGKGDRLQLVPALHQNTVNQRHVIKILRTPAFDLKLADGCESLVSPLAHAGLATVAGRCVS